MPLLGHPPAFDWNAFASFLAKSLGLPSLTISPGDVVWRVQAETCKGLGEDPNILTIAVSPLQGRAYWIFPKEALKSLFALTVGTEEALFPEQQIEWEKEFYHFAAFEAVQAFSKTEFDRSLLPQLLEGSTLPEGALFCIDLILKIEGKELTGRLALDPEMRESFEKKFHQTTLTIPPGIEETSLVTLQAIGGKTSLSLEEWRSIHPGDVLLFDSCTLSTEENKGRVALWFDGKPLFRAQTKENQLKILEYPLLNEVTTPMARKDEFDEEDEEFETEEESTFEEHPTEDEEMTEEETLEGELDLEEDLEVEEEEEHEQAAVPPKPEALSKSSTHAQQTQGPSPLANPEEIPMTVTIETGRIQMTIKQLMELAPGNVIDLDIRPERGVDLTVNGRCVGRGELLKIGETLGVRILEKA